MIWLLFVARKFRENREYTELKHLYPQQARHLAENIVFKGEQVLPEVLLVVNDLLDSMTEVPQYLTYGHP